MRFVNTAKKTTGLALLVFGVVSSASAAQAQSASTASGSGQPARAVRLSYVDGQVTLAQSGQVLAQQAVVNTPLFQGMQLTTGDTGKAEIQFEDGSVARISPDSSLTLAVLQGAGTTANAVMVVNGGLAYFEFQGGGLAGRMSVQFGDAQVTTGGFTVLRVTLDSPPGQLAVFSGNAHLDAAHGAVSADLHGGESIVLNGANPSNYQLAESIDPDSWDAWNSDRDQALTAEAANQTGAANQLGANENPEWNDLDSGGNWYNVPGQGYVWSPYEAANSGFDPYGYGNWMWTPGYGYLWISGYPWGYLPFQCGAWNFYTGFGWGWAPGMGGCAPWWRLGVWGGPNIGYAPPGYQPVPRPIGPRHPIRPQPLAMIPVRRGPVPAVTAFQVRNRNAPVTIAGNTVTPLHRLPVQPAFYRGYRGQPVSGSSRGTLVGSPAAVQGAPMTARPGYSFHGTSGSTSADPRQFSHPPNAEPGQFNRPVTSQGATPPVRSSYTRSSDNNQITVSPSGSRSSDSEGIEPSSRPAFVQDGSSHQGEDTVGISQPHETGSAGGGSPHPGGSAPHPSGGGSPHPSGGGSAPHPSGGGGGGGASHTGSSGGGGGGTHGK